MSRLQTIKTLAHQQMHQKSHKSIQIGRTPRGIIMLFQDLIKKGTPTSTRK